MEYSVNPSSIGQNLLIDLSLNDFLPFLNKKFLFYKLWAFTPQNFKDDPLLKQEIEATLLKMNKIAQEIIKPKAIYAIYPCQSENEMLKIFPSRHANCTNCSSCNLLSKTQNPIKIFFFERDKDTQQNISDYFNSVYSSKIDFIGIQLVTLGDSAVRYAEKLKSEDAYQDYFYWYGYCSALTEALAGFVHQKIRKELGIWNSAETFEDEWSMNYRGRRYSFGYKWCTDMSEQRKALDLLNSEQIEVKMNEGDELEPEFSTCALVVHHPEATYY